MDSDIVKRVAWDEIGNVRVSTVYVGAFQPFFETMIKRGDGVWDEQWRYSTLDEAIAGHAAVVAWVKGEGERTE